MTRVAAIQSNYVPWKGYFDIIHDVDVFVFYDEVKYTKNDWRNRNRIYSANGLEWLTIPISKTSTRLKISEVTLEDPSWQKRHHKSLYHAYRSAPRFAELEALIDEGLLGREWAKLADLNRFFIERICRRLGITTKFVDAKDHPASGDRVGKLIDLLKQLRTDEYLTGPAARDYISDAATAFTDNSIRVSYKDYAGYPAYRQRRKPFQGEVSILDMIANLGWEKIPDHIWGWRSEARTRSP